MRGLQDMLEMKVSINMKYPGATALILENGIQNLNLVKHCQKERGNEGLKSSDKKQRI